jgi:5'-nucleotidase
MTARLARDERQLALPLPGVAGSGEVPRIARADRVFVNRSLQLTSVDWVGFDMDYTLAIYRQDEMDALQVRVTVERLVERGWPEALRELDFDTRFSIRGLLVDKRHGHVLKMDRHKVVDTGYHGTRPLSGKELDALYQEKRIRPHTARYHWIDTLFSLCEVTTYVAIVDALEHRGVAIDFERLWIDIRECIDSAHRDGTIHAAVLAALPRFVERDPLLARTLHKLRSAGKRLFLLTNSPAPYTERVMAWLLDGSMSEYPAWRHYFDVVIVAAQKPHWFQEGRPLLERDGDVLRNVRGPLERDRIYEGGSLAEFERSLGIGGSNVLYVGDHIFGDILRSKKESSWRTAMIIPELGQELEAHDACLEQIGRYRQLGDLRERLDDELRWHQGSFKELGRRKEPEARAEQVRVKRALDQVRAQIRALDAEEHELKTLIDRRFHPYWGSLLKDHNERSSFGLQVDSYADIYMRRVSCLYGYSPQQSFRSPHDLMPHEL